MNRLPLETRVQILSMLCKGSVNRSMVDDRFLGDHEVGDQRCRGVMLEPLAEIVPS
jgi:hypothetical protein